MKQMKPKTVMLPPCDKTVLQRRGTDLLLKRFALILLAGLMVGLATWNLTNYPTISGWDEGVFLQFAKNLLHYGEYGTRNGATFERMLPNGGSGPTFIVAVALGMALGGDTLLAARAVMVIFLISSVVASYVLLNRLGGTIAAFFGTLCYVQAGYQSYDTLWLGRQVLAEIPALSFVLVGWLFWQQSWSEKKFNLGVASLCLFLAALTKNQLILVLLPSFILIGLIDRLYYRCLRWRHSIIPFLAVAAGYSLWSIVAIWIAGPEQQAIYIESLKAVTAAQFLHVGPTRWIENLRMIYRSGQGTLVVLALGFGFWQSRQRDENGLAILSLSLLTAVALASFLLVSPSWPRYLHLPLALAMLCIGVLASNLVYWALARWPDRHILIMSAFSSLMVILIGSRFLANVQRIVKTSDNSACQFAQMLDSQLPLDAHFLNWEWELEFYSSRTFIHPDFRLFPALIDATYNGQHATILDAPRIPATATYVVVGPFASQTRVFDLELTMRSAQLIADVGPYHLYEILKTVAHPSPVGSK